MKPPAFSHLRDVLRWRAVHQAEQIAFTFLVDGEAQCQDLSYAELDAWARAIALRLQQECAPQERVILLIPTGLSFVAALMGCVYANLIAVPVPAHFHDPQRLRRTLPRLQAIVADAQASVVLGAAATEAQQSLILEQVPALQALPWLNVDTLAQEQADDWQPRPLQAADLIFLQYSSGSTGRPKGVMVSHGNLMHNAAALQQAFGHTEQRVGVSWLPAYHDLGLVADILQPIYSGHREVLLSPFDFIQRPLRWLEAISRYGAHTSGAPNFAYALCVQKSTPQQRADLDLSRWQLAYNCAEPVSAQVMQDFAEAFAVAGFQAHAFFPFLGMAEATLMVSAGQRGRLARCLPLSRAGLRAGRVALAAETQTETQTQILVSNGRPLPGHELLIVNPLTCQPCAAQQIGEIWLAGPSVAQGYWRQPEATQASFQAVLTRSTGDTAHELRKYLRTGDLGCLQDGELLITGRMKDLLIIQGQNIYPQDLEQTLEQAHPLLRPGCSVAFSLPAAETEQLVLVAEVQDTAQANDLPALVQTIQAQMLSHHQLLTHDILLLQARTLPKTSSGKVQRQACREAFLAGTFAGLRYQLRVAQPSAGQQAAEAVTPDFAETAIQEQVAEIWGQVLQQNVGLDDDFFALGGHSLQATEVLQRIQTHFQLPFSLAQFFAAPTLRALAADLKRALQASETLPPASERELAQTQENAAGSELLAVAPLLPAQARFWFTEQLRPGDASAHMPVALRLSGPLQREALQASLNALLQRHEVLRTRFFEREPGQPWQVVEAVAALELGWVDLSDLPPALQLEQLHKQLARAALQPFAFDQPPLMRATLYHLSQHEHVLMLNLHHLIGDGWSMGVLYQDWQVLYAQALVADGASGQESDLPDLPDLPLRYLDYVRWQQEQLAKGAWAEQLAYWQLQLKDLPRLVWPRHLQPATALSPLRLPTAPACGQAFLQLPQPLLLALKALARQEQVSLFMLLLAAFKVLLFRWTGQSDLAVATPVAGRHLPGSEALLGCLINTLVLRSQVPATAPFSDYLATVREQALAAYAHQELPFEQVVQAVNPQRFQDQHPLTQVLFALQNTPHAPLALSGLELEPVAFAPVPPRLALECQLWEHEHGLDCQLFYQPERFAQEAMQVLLPQFAAVLQSLVADPQQAIASLSWQPAAQTDDVLLSQSAHEIQPAEPLSGWPGAVAQPLLQALAEHGRSQPTALALQAGSQSLTYADLQKSVAGWLQRIQASGVAAGARVGLELEPGLDSVAIWLALLQGGYLMVPLAAAGQVDADWEQPELLAQSQLALRIRSVRVAMQAEIQTDIHSEIQLERLPVEALATDLPVLAYPADTVLLQYVRTAEGSWQALPFSELDLLELTQRPASQPKALLDPWLSERLWLPCWQDLFQGQAHVCSVQIPSRPDLQGQWRYHLADLNPALRQRFSTALASLSTRATAPALASAPLAYASGGSLQRAPDSPGSVIEMLLRAEQVTQRGLRLIDAQGEVVWLSYAELVHEARRVCQGLQSLGLLPGAAVVLQIESQAGHFMAFCGAILGGFVPVAVAIPPHYSPEQALVQKLAHVLDWLEAPLLLCSQSNLVALQQLSASGRLPAAELLTLESLLVHAPSAQIHAPQPTETVFYQLSSGSTGQPKCIQISHQGILAHCEAVGQVHGYASHEVWLNWIPLDHVVPILTWFFQALYRQAELVQVASQYILQQPLRWLALLEQYQVNHSWSPNFGFQLVAEALQQATERPHYDLRALRSLMNAGEQVTQPVMAAFVSQTQGFGLHETVLNPAFGMAEACTCITYERQFSLTGSLHQLDDSAVGFVSTGPLIPGVEIRIVNAENQLLQERQLGRLQIRGAVVTQGYVRHEAANQEAFVGQGWFNSGDLGFLHQGRLYLTGREKEMIVVRGANLYCYEVEALVGELAGVRAGWVAVFPLSLAQQGSEGFGIAYVPEDPSEAFQVIPSIKKAVSERLGLSPEHLLPLSAEDFPKTSSGKIMRSQIAKQLVQGDYDEQLKAVDLALGNQQTCPDSFFQADWYEQPLAVADLHSQLSQSAVLLVLGGSSATAAMAAPVARALADLLRPQCKALRLLSVAEPGLTEHPAEQHYAEYFAEDCAALYAADPAELLVLSLQPPPWDPADFDAYQQPLQQSLALIQAIMEPSPALSPSGLTACPVRWLQLQVSPPEGPSPDEGLQGALQGLLCSLEQERAQSRVQLLAYHGPLQKLGSCLLAELAAPQPLARRIRYLGTRRWVRQLERVSFSRAVVGQQLAFAPQQLTLMLGGLGGIGAELARWILQQPQQEVLIVGRRALPLEEHEEHEGQAARSEAERKWQALQALAQAQGNRLDYLQYDLLQADPEAFLAALAERAGIAGSPASSLPVSTIIQAVGEPYAEQGLAELKSEALLRDLRLKHRVSHLISHLISHPIQQPDVMSATGLRLIEIGSVNGYFGGFQVGAYAVAQGYLDGLAANGPGPAHLLSRQGLAYYSLHQSHWHETGMSVGRPHRAWHKGFLSLARQAGVQGIVSLLNQPPAAYYLGLDGHKATVQAQLSARSQHWLKHLSPGLPRLEAVLGTYLTGQIGPLSELHWQQLRPQIARRLQLQVCDSQGQRVAYPLLGDLLLIWPGVQLLTGLRAHYLPDGRICLAPAATTAAEAGQQAIETELAWPETPMERAFCQIFAQVLGRERIGLHDDFFALGGHSLLAVQVMARLRAHVQRDVPLSSLFEHPTVAGLLQALQQEENPNAAAASLPELIRLGPGQPRPLSFAQERLWFMAQFMDHSPAQRALYNTLFCLQLRGDLQVQALADSLQALVQRHEVLRSACLPPLAETPFDAGPSTEFTQTQTQIQIQSQIQDALPVALPVLDLRADSDPAAQARELAQALARQPFDLAQPPLWRVQLLQLSDSRHCLVLVFHHIISDAGSVRIFLQELAQYYSQFCVQPEDAASPGSGAGAEMLGDGAVSQLQYADYAHWQRAWLAGPALQAQLSYWQAQLAQAPELLPLPTDWPRPAQLSYAGGLLHFDCEPELSEALEALARREGLTRFMLLQAAFQILLFRYSGQSDILVGIPVTRRQLPALEGLMGLFVNTLVIRGDLSGQPSLREFLQQIKARCLAAYAHQDLPFEKLIEVLNPPRSLSHHPLFQVMFVLQEADALPDLQLPGLQAELERPGEGFAKFDLSLEMIQHAAGLSGRLEYSTELFAPETIERLAGHYLMLLRGLVADLQQTVSQVPLLTAPERVQLLQTWNQTQAAYPRQGCIHQLFEAQVARQPERTALVFQTPDGSQTLSYDRLNARANQLAHYLIGQGVGPEVLVGISLQRSPQMLVGLLAILKAGGAYVPLDPDYPPERLHFMQQDTELKLVLTQQTFQPLWAEAGVQTLCLDVAQPPWAALPTQDPVSGVGLDNLISVIYTSGSTGQPKGVLNTHLGVYNHLSYRQSAYPMFPEDRIIQKTSLNFDGSVWECFWPLMVGATLYLASPAGHKDSFYLNHFVQTHGITMIDFVPAMLQAVLNEPEQPDFRSLRRVWCGGEGLSYALQQAFFEAYPEISLIHGYGPTETTVSVTYWRCEPGTDSQLVPIGRPNANIQIYLLDTERQPVPIGVAGEIYIGGDGLARGYLKRPELSAEKFVPNPFGPGKLYRSGDLARYLPTGAIVFLGRVDHQIKLRGFRIEPGEIENLLREHAQVQSALVMLREDPPAARQLVAYFVASDPLSPPPVPELRAWLSRKLPDYMVPSAFVSLAQWPLDVNGKVSRQALPVPSLAQGSANLAPRSPEEAALAEIFGGLLGLPELGLDDDFFALGGHSLLATQLAARIRTVLQRELPLRAIFEQPTVAGLHRLLQQQQQQPESELLPPLTAQPLSQPRHQPWPLSFAQERLWFMDQLAPQSALYNIPVLLSLSGSLDSQALERSLAWLLQRHESLRTRFVRQQDQACQQMVPVSEILSAWKLSIEDLSAAADPEASARQLAAAEALTPFDLGQAPLWRARLLKLAPRRHWLLLNLHHIISDGWSLRVMLQELSQAYASFKAGEEPDLPKLPVQYADFAQWQRSWFAGPVFQTQLQYWQEQLTPLPGLLPLPSDHPRPAVENYQGRRETFHYSADLSTALKALARAEGVTLFMLLLTAFQVFLFRLSQHTDLAVGVPVANRRQQASEGLIGFFVNTLVIRGDLSGDPDFRSLLQQIKARCLAAYAHQDLPFEKLVEALNPRRDLSHHALFQVLFVLQDFSLDSLAWEGLETQLEALDSQSSRFDLSLELIPVRQSHPAGLAEHLKVRVEYSTALFESATIARWMQHFETLLQAIVAQPQARISSLRLLPPAAASALVQAWNPACNRTAAADWAEQMAVHQRFAALAQQEPEAVALVCAGQTLSYAELETHATELAQALQAAGVGPGHCVAVCLERSLAWVVALLAIFKAGGIYLPLDPSWPAARRERILAEAQPLLQLDASLTVPAPASVSGAAAVAELAVGGEAVAYLLYTSGSTGQPKGALLTHAGLSNMIAAQIETLEISPQSRVLQHASIGFDASLSEVWMALCAGARLCIGSRAELLPGPALQNYILQAGISIMTLPPSLLALLPPFEAPSLQTLLVAGEACPLELAQTWSQHCRVFNAYGPTEATVCTTLGEYLPGSPLLSLGRPLAQTQVYVLDSALQPVPIGVPGELYIGGRGLALGYLKRPELTAAAFVPNPFGPGRLYKSGDRVKALPDGQLQFLGRQDQQVKLRGMRLELGEIEAQLKAQPQLQTALVRCLNVKGQPSLVAYLVPHPLSEPSQIEALEQEQLQHWQTLYQQAQPRAQPRAQTITQAAAPPGDDFTGWNSALDGQPLPRSEMLGWRDATVQRILSLQPQRVYEIGCGTGLLLSQIAPQVQHYWASDFAAPALAAVRALNLQQVQLLERRADDFAGLPAQYFDSLILNSVVQYFPSAEYLLKVLRQALSVLQPGGQILIGDVRDLRLLEPLAAAAVCHQARQQLQPAAEPVAAHTLQHQLMWRLQREPELCLDPAFFATLPTTLPELAAVEILHKRGQGPTELTAYRYDVILYLAPGPESLGPGSDSDSDSDSELSWLDWQPGLSLAQLASRYQQQAGALGLRHVPHAGLAEGWQALQLIQAATGLAALETQVAPAEPVLGEEPESFYRLGAELGCQVKVLPEADPACFSVILSPQARICQPLAGPELANVTRLSNQPLHNKRLSHLLPELKRALAEQLPTYMLPSHYLLLEALPLNASGKVDFQALPVPGQDPEPVAERAYLAPQSELEQLLATLYAELLGRERVGRQADFFALGGHSLLAIQLLSRLQAHLQVNLPLQMLFAFPTVAGLAQHLQQKVLQPTQGHRLPRGQARQVQISKAPPGQALKLSYSQELWWTLFPTQAELEHGIQNSYAGIRLQGPLDAQALEQSLNTIIARHEALRTHFTQIERRPRRVVSDQVPFALSLADHSGQHESQVIPLLEAQAQAAFDLSRGPLIRAGLYRLGPASHLLMLSVSHLVFDGLSLKNLLYELNLIYTGLSQNLNPAANLPELPMQYSDYVHWHRKWIKHTVLKQQLWYWLRKGRDMPVVLDLPTDKPRPALLSMAGSSVSFALDAAQVQELQALSQQAGCTLYMTLLAAFQVLLHQYSGQTDIFVGTPVANRPLKALENLIGLFVNFIVLRGDLAGNPRFADYLQQVKNTCLEAYAHQDLPFQILLKSFKAFKTLTAFQGFQTQKTARSNVMFNLVDDLGAEFQLGELQASLLPLQNHYASQALHLILLKSPSGIQGQLTYSEDLFYAETAKQLSTDYQRILQRIVADPGLALQAL